MSETSDETPVDPPPAENPPSDPPEDEIPGDPPADDPPVDDPPPEPEPEPEPEPQPPVQETFYYKLEAQTYPPGRYGPFRMDNLNKWGMVSGVMRLKQGTPWPADSGTTPVVKFEILFDTDDGVLCSVGASFGSVFRKKGGTTDIAGVSIGAYAPEEAPIVSCYFYFETLVQLNASFTLEVS